MDIEETKKFILNKIENDNLVKKVRDVIKITKWQKQDAREGFSETFKPLIETQEKVSEDINKQQKKLEANQEALTKSLLDNQLALTQGIKRLALRDKEEEFQTPPSSPTSSSPPIKENKESIINKLSSEVLKEQLKPTNIKIDLEKEFKENEIEALIELNFVRPKNLLSLSDDSLDELIDNSNKVIKSLNGQRVGLTRKKEISEEEQKKLRKIDNLQETMIKYKTKAINFKEARKGFQVGKGIYYNNPYQLIDRLELLTGSILAGNNGVIPEFIKIVHILNKNKWIKKEHLNNLIKSVSLKWGAQL